MHASLIPALFLALALAPPAASRNAAATESDADAVARRDRELNALIVRNDAAAAGAYYDEQFVLTTSSGKAKSRADVLGEIAQPALAMDRNETTQVQVRVRGT